MPNQLDYIPTGGIGEIEYDLEEKGWYAIQSSKYNENKVIPYLKLLIDLGDTLIKCLKNQRRQERYTNYLPRAIRTIKLCSGLTKSSIEIEKI